MPRDNSVLFALADIRHLETARRNDETAARAAAEAEAAAIAAAEAQRRREEAELLRLRAELADAQRERDAEKHACDAAHRRVSELAAELVLAQHRLAAPPARPTAPSAGHAPLVLGLAIFAVGALAFFGGTRSGRIVRVPEIVAAPAPIVEPAVAATPPTAPVVAAAPVVREPVRRLRPAVRKTPSPDERAATTAHQLASKLAACKNDPACGLDLGD